MLTRKRFLEIAFFLISFFTVWAGAIHCFAQEKFPAKPISLIVGFAPGGTGDLPLRYLADLASKKLGQPMLVVNREGGGGTVALTEITNAKPDGYTIGFLSTGGVISAHMRKIPYDPVKDLEPIIQHAVTVYGLAVRSDSPFQTLPDLITYARANPKKVTYSTAGAGTPQHLVMIQLGEVAKVKWTHIPMGGGVPAVTQLLGGHVTCASQAPEWKPYVNSGRLRLLALYTEKRMPEYPDVPTLIDLGYNITAFNLYSVVGPKGIPQERVQMLHDAFFQGMQDPGYPELLKKIDMQYGHRNPQDLKKFIKEIYDASGEILKNLEKK
jgi:tripartite-type tricarboxylate transporter receptor subunit TctC